MHYLSSRQWHVINYDMKESLINMKEFLCACTFIWHRTDLDKSNLWWVKPNTRGFVVSMSSATQHNHVLWKRATYFPSIYCYCSVSCQWYNFMWRKTYTLRFIIDMKHYNNYVLMSYKSFLTRVFNDRISL